MIQVTEVIEDPDFAQTIYVTRTTSAWVMGSFVPQQSEQLTLYGTVTAANARDLDQVPEGDRQKGIMCFYTPQQLYTTGNNDNHVGPSDIVTWRGNKYRIIQIFPQMDYGYCKALGAQEEAE